jgi:glyoxylase-like metal-dependent hydrolase (beta-lactamase superfamily II)
MTLEGTNTWILSEVGGQTCVVVDPGPAVHGHLDAVLHQCEELGATIGAIVLTHDHADHAEGAARLSEVTGAPVLGRRDGTLDEGDLATLGQSGPQLRIVRLPGHTSDSVGIVFAADHAIATGDLIFDRGSAMIDWPDGSLADYFDTLDQLRSLVVEHGVIRLLPGHGGAIDDPLDQIARYESHRRQRLEQVRTALAGATGGDVDAVLQAVYGDVDAGLRTAARWTVQAQLQYLTDTAGRTCA